MRLVDRPQRSSREDPGGNPDEHDDHDVADHEGEPDALDGRLVGRLRERLRGELRADVERRSEDRHEAEVEGDAEHAEDEGEQPDVQGRQADSCPPEHHRGLLVRMRYPEPRTVSIRPSRRPSSTFRRRLRM